MNKANNFSDNGTTSGVTYEDVLGKPLQLEQNEVLSLLKSLKAHREELNAMKEEGKTTSEMCELKCLLNREETRFVKAMLGLVYDRAHEFNKKYNYCFENLVSAGLLGLSEAINNFNVAKDAYITIFNIYITQAMKGEIRDGMTTLSIPDGIKKTIRKIYAQANKVNAYSNYETDSVDYFNIVLEMADQNGFDREYMTNYHNARYNVSFDSYNLQDSDSDYYSARDKIEGEILNKSYSDEDPLVTEQIRDIIYEELGEVDADIVYRNGGLGESFANIGRDYGFSRANAKQRYDKAIAKLQNSARLREYKSLNLQSNNNASLC